MLRIVTLDPGGETGACVFTEREDGSYTAEPYQFGPKPHHVQLHDFLFDHLVGKVADVPGNSARVVCEGFNNRGNIAAQLISLEYIGVVKLFCGREHMPLTLQMSSVKTFSTDDKLRACGLWFVGQKHARDAGRHLLKYMIDHERNRPCTKKWLQAIRYL